MGVRLTVLLFTALFTNMAAAAQVDPERFEAAKRRLAEKQAAATQPSRTAGNGEEAGPSQRDTQAPILIWRIKPDAPAAFHNWLEQAPQRRAEQVARLERELVEERAELVRQQAELRRVHRRRLRQVRFKGSLGQWHTKPDPRDAARRRGEVREQQAVVTAHQLRIVEITKQLESGPAGPEDLELLSFDDTGGSFGHLTSAVKVRHVIDVTNCVVIYNGTSYLLEGYETSDLTADTEVEVVSPVLRLPERRMASGPRVRGRLPVLRVFDWLDYFDLVDVAEEATKLAPRRRLGPLGEPLDEPEAPRPPTPTR